METGRPTLGVYYNPQVKNVNNGVLSIFRIKLSTVTQTSCQLRIWIWCISEPDKIQAQYLKYLDVRVYELQPPTMTYTSKM